MKNRFIVALFLFAVLTIGILPLAAQDEAPFPVTVEHKFGSTTLTEAPQRIVVLGFTEQDAYYALGEYPVAIRYWYGDENDAIFPWAEEAAGDSDPMILNMTYGALNYEAILELDPDFISAVGSGITEDEYETLSAIAPTLAQSGEYVNFGMPWQESLQLIGTAIGKGDEAAALIADVDTQFEAVREENPQFVGKTVAVAYSTQPGIYGYYTGQDSRGRFFTDLGFVISDELNEFAGDSFYYDISEERIDLLNQDLLVFLALQFNEAGSSGTRDAIANDDLLNQLEVMQEERVLYVADEYDDAMQFTTVLSVQYLIDNLVPELQAIFPPVESAMNDMTETDCDAGLRAVADANDVMVCVPENPQRIIALQEGDIDSLLALGITPIGATNGRGQSTPPRYLSEDLGEAAVSVGGFFQPNLEVVLELEPDLILFAGYDDPEVLEQLNAIAPVYNSAGRGDDWRTQLRRVGDVVNQSDAAEMFISDFDARVASLSDALGDRANDQFIVARWTADGPQLMTPVTFSSAVLMELGMRPLEEFPELQEGHPHTAPLSLETLELLDVDWAFVGTLQGAGDAVTTLEEVFDNPLFQQLQVVQDEHVIVIDGSLWTSVGGALAANRVLDVVENQIVETE